jgi:KDO2-lipid IV(A) lauroyltransferase
LDPKLLNPRFWPAWLGFGLLRIVILLPYPVLLRLGRALGWLGRHLARQRADIARRNIGLCFPQLTEQERQQLLEAHFASLGIGIFEIALAWWASDRRLAGLAEVSGLENLQAASAQGNGVLLLSAHFTCLELGGRFLTRHVPLDAMYRQTASPVVEHLTASRRANFSGEIIPRDALKKMLRRLRDGHAVWYAPDQNTQRKKAVFVKFFGHLASTTPATHKLAGVSGARVVPFKAVRKADGSGYRLSLEPALDAFPSEDAEADTQRINDIIERWVREDPEQYLWIHRRFRTRPDHNDPRLY